MTQTIRRINSIEDAMDAYRLTRAEIEACSFVRNADGAYFFTVQSRTQHGVIYKVIYNPAMKRLQCVSFDGGPVCKASEDGFNCWHKRAAMARAILVRLECLHEQERAWELAELEQRQEQETQYNLPAITPEKEAQVKELCQWTDPETARRVAYAQPKRGAKVRDEDRSFRLLK